MNGWRQRFQGGKSDLFAWSDESPEEAVAELAKAEEGGVSFLKVTSEPFDAKGNYLSFQEVWSATIQEAIVAGEATRWSALIGNAKAGVITRKQFIDETLRFRFDILLEKKNVFESVIVPWAEKVASWTF